MHTQGEDDISMVLLYQNNRKKLHSNGSILTFYNFSRNKKRVKLSDLCFLIPVRLHDSILLGEEGKILPKKGCLQISPASLWKDVNRYGNDIVFF